MNGLSVNESVGKRHAMSRKSIVYSRRIEGDEPDDRIQKMLEGMSKEEIAIDDGYHVCIKPNICIMKKANTGATTDPRVVSSIVDFLVSNWRCKISIVESDATINNLEACYLALGWRRLAREKDVQLVNLSKAPRIEVSVNGYYLKDIAVPKLLHEADYIISVPKLKVHDLTGITGALKNQFGCLPERYKAKYHHHIHEVVADVNRVLAPKLVVTDALTILKGGAIAGTPERANMIFASKDPVANDSLCAKMVGFNPRSIKHIRLCEDAGLGSSSFILRGDRVKLPISGMSSKTMLDRLTSLFLSIAK